MTRIYLHPLPVRIWHWTNALAFLGLIVTALQIRYVGLFEWMPFKTAVQVHNWVGFVLIANFFLWLLFYLSSDKIRAYHPELSPAKHFRQSFRQLRFYGYGIFRGEPNPHHASPYNKFNPLQAMTYQIVMFILLPVQILTGLMMWDVERFSGLVEAVGGLRVVDTVHVLVFAAFVFYLFVHVYLGAMGHTPSAHFKAMITGFEDEPEPPGARTT